MKVKEIKAILANIQDDEEIEGFQEIALYNNLSKAKIHLVIKLNDTLITNFLDKQTLKEAINTGEIRDRISLEEYFADNGYIGDLFEYFDFEIKIKN